MLPVRKFNRPPSGTLRLWLLLWGFWLMGCATDDSEDIWSSSNHGKMQLDFDILVVAAADGKVDVVDHGRCRGSRGRTRQIGSLSRGEGFGIAAALFHDEILGGCAQGIGRGGGGGLLALIQPAPSEPTGARRHADAAALSGRGEPP